MAARALRLRAELWKRALALTARFEASEVRWALGGKVSEHDVLRMALERGLAELERDHQEPP